MIRTQRSRQLADIDGRIQSRTQVVPTTPQRVLAGGATACMQACLGISAGPSAPLQLCSTRTHVDEGRGVAAAANAVVVNLCAGTAGTLIAHLPKVVLAAKGQHTLSGQEAQPDAACLFVCRQALCMRALVWEGEGFNYSS